RYSVVSARTVPTTPPAPTPSNQVSTERLPIGLVRPRRPPSNELRVRSIRVLPVALRLDQVGTELAPVISAEAAQSPPHQLRVAEYCLAPAAPRPSCHLDHLEAERASVKPISKCRFRRRGPAQARWAMS